MAKRKKPASDQHASRAKTAAAPCRRKKPAPPDRLDLPDHLEATAVAEFHQEEANRRARRRVGQAAKRSSGIPLKTFVEAMMAINESGLVEAVQNAILEAATRRGMPRDQYLDLHGLRRTYYDAVELHERWVKCPDKLVQVLDGLQIPIASLVSPNPRLPPWSDFRPGSTIVLAIGEKLYRDEVLVQQAVGVHDVHAQIELFSLLNETLQLRFRVEVHLIPIDSSPAEAADDFKRLRDRDDVGLIITIGAPIVNAMTEPLAKTIFDRAAVHESPARFRWPFDLRQTLNIPLPDNPVLVSLAPGPEGIITSSGKFLPRTPKRQIVEAVRRGFYGPFPDVGMLLMDVSCEPYLVAAAGHSGSATIATCKAIGMVEEIFRRLEQSKSPDSLLGPDRILALVEVDRYKPPKTDPKRNDLYFHPDYGKGWRFVDGD